ncbi:MAG: molybdopterin-dependent oxidoreductase [Deltaproteobacteria bacterium]|nr:molybdopterin-dependent oxidoreductase [Deltaproteobacteria bacterium]
MTRDAAPEGRSLAALTRRELLVASAAASAALALRCLAPATQQTSDSPASPAAPGTPPAYESFADVYRSAWRWDRVVRGTHLRANCFSACAFDLFVKDGIVWREEQADVYAREGVDLPDYAPRGCQKGSSYSDLAVAPDRLLHPMERVGPRGSGRWRRISWDEAIGRLADSMLDAISGAGAETVVYDNGTSNVDSGPSTVGEMRLFGTLGATMLDGFGGTGDLAMGAVQTWGTTFVDGSADDWCRAETLLVWHCNPTSTRIPDAHFLTEARYRGTNVVCVTPDYSPSAIHTSLWVSPRPGSDAALALGLARSVLERGAVDAAYVREQTDLPLLVRDDDGRYLRQSDLEDGGRDDVFYVWDGRSGKLAEAPGSSGLRSDSLALGDLAPALAGRFEAQTRDGRRVAVRPVFERLRERLAAYGPRDVERITGVSPDAQQRLADLVVASPRLLIYASWGSNKSHHADLLQRALILVSALRGQHGHAGSGVRFAAWIALDGADEMISPGQVPWWQKAMLRVYTPPPRMMEDAIAKVTRERLTWTPSHLFLAVHGGLAGAQDLAAAQGSAPLRTPSAAINEAFANRWIRVRPAADNPPRVLVTSGVNPLRRWPVPQVIERTLWPKLALIAAIDFRVSSTGAKADLLLPAAGYYEKNGIKYSVALTPYAVVGERAMSPLGDSKPEWEIMSLLARALQERARARGLGEPLETFADRFSDGGRYGPGDDVALLDRILRDSSATKMSWDEARRRGAVQMKTTGRWGPTQAIGSDYEPGGTLYPSRVHVEERHAWPTLTGRQQFYIDHPWFFDADEVLPRWKPLPGESPAHPIRLTGGHTRWSIHAIWRAHPDLLRLQRGEPSMWMAESDAQARSVRDNDVVRVHNEQGSFQVRARIAPGVQPGEAILYHAWEPYQFAGWRSMMEVIASPLKPTHLVGDYGHLRERVFQNGPMHAPRGVAVEIERVDQPLG